MKKLGGRSHILEGVAAALLRVDEVIDVMKHAKDASEVRSKLMEPAFGFSTAQANNLLLLLFMSCAMSYILGRRDT